ncbi:MAG: hypothetical protein K0S23_3361 [Fluviicola sp.]|jgi:hypothetical protein|uniref:hypothetical protein n=1 Tax=Fluviicola sp. TaxID=1917219 RepID=UPI0026339982|nr:hypothetical protein [Fluviicola sp.]MDF3029054.1 hypothetical protein [Fluviicola sp.]
MHFKLLPILFIAISIFSCTPNESDAETKAAERAELLKDPEGVKQTKPDLFASVPFKQLPVVDTTNFDNFNGEHKLSKDLISKLHLKSLGADYETLHTRYRLALSTDIDLVVITVTSETEMKTYLVSHTKQDYKVIDKVLISYDEIAESMSRSEGRIGADEVVVTSYSDWGEEPSVELKKYRIEKSGKFIQK